MRLTKLFKDQNSGVGQCPTVYETDRGTFVVQGQRVSDPEAMASLEDMLEGETAVEVPREVLLGAARKAG